MEKNTLKIKLEELLDDISELSEDTIVVIDDYDEMADDDFWDEG
jgi:ATP/maltotriose-dependent transcriptional regulator MalT